MSKGCRPQKTNTLRRSKVTPLANSEPLLHRPGSRPRSRKLVDIQKFSSQLSLSSIGRKVVEEVYSKLEIKIVTARFLFSS